MIQKYKSQTFNDGSVSIYSINHDDSLTLKIPNLRFEERTVGSKRFFEASQAQYNITHVIRVPLASTIRSNDAVCLDDKIYKIVQQQKIKDVSPQCWQLTLEESQLSLEMVRNENID